jgi:hypothetical protein
MTGLWSYGKKAADGRFADPAAACYPVVVCAARPALGRESHPPPTVGSATPEIAEARATLEHRSLGDGVAVSAVSVAARRDHHRPA